MRCAVENDLADRDDTPQLYSDELVRARFSLFTRRYRLWVFVLFGWILYLSFGRGIELWSNILFLVLLLCTFAAPVLHYLGSTRFNAELAKLTP